MSWKIDEPDNVARTLVFAASTLVSTLFSPPYFLRCRQCGIECEALAASGVRTAPKSVGTSADAAGMSAWHECPRHKRHCPN